MVPTFQSKEELYEYLKLNKDLLVRQKKSQMKYADAISYNQIADESDVVDKGINSGIDEDPKNIRVKAVINTTNIMDSHDDVHFPNLWKKSLSENKTILHLQEHQMQFDKLISDKVNAYTENISWSKMGYPYEGKTQALIFDSEIDVEDNAYMFEQYKKGRVRNHSVGMQYVKVALAVNSKDSAFKEEKETWNKYIDSIVNKEVAEEKGYFFAVTEAKVIEGSAVLVGSNRATPTLSVSEADKGLAIPDTSEHITEEPQQSTPKVDWNFIINTLKTSK